MRRRQTIKNKFAALDKKQNFHSAINGKNINFRCEGAFSDLLHFFRGSKKKYILCLYFQDIPSLEIRP